MSTLGWLASVASSTFVVTTQIQAMVETTNLSFAGFPNWQYTLIMLAFPRRFPRSRQQWRVEQHWNSLSDQSGHSDVLQPR
jgi:hypothetical protein